MAAISLYEGVLLLSLLIFGEFDKGLAMVIFSHLAIHPNTQLMLTPPRQLSSIHTISTSGGQLLPSMTLTSVPTSTKAGQIIHGFCLYYSYDYQFSYSTFSIKLPSDKLYHCAQCYTKSIVNQYRTVTVTYLLSPKQVRSLIWSLVQQSLSYQYFFRPNSDQFWCHSRICFGAAALVMVALLLIIFPIAVCAAKWKSKSWNSLKKSTTEMDSRDEQQLVSMEVQYDIISGAVTFVKIQITS